MSSAAYTERRCPVVINGRPGTRDGDLGCIFTRGHKVPHRFIAPDSTLRWWPVELGEPPAWDAAITTPATDPRWPKRCPVSDAATALRRLRCRMLGHKDEYRDWRYEQGRTLAVVGGVEAEVLVTWACCEVCSRCGSEVWTPW